MMVRSVSNTYFSAASSGGYLHVPFVCVCVCVLPSQPREEIEYRGYSGLENKANAGETYFGHLLPV